MTQDTQSHHLQRGQLLLQQRRLEDAVKELNAATAVDLTDPYAPAFLALVSHDIGRIT